MSKIILLKIKASGETFDCTVIHYLLNADMTYNSENKTIIFVFTCRCNSSVANQAKSSLNGYIVNKQTGVSTSGVSKIDVKSINTNFNIFAVFPPKDV